MGDVWRLHYTLHNSAQSLFKLKTGVESRQSAGWSVQCVISDEKKEEEGGGLWMVPRDEDWGPVLTITLLINTLFVFCRER